MSPTTTKPKRYLDRAGRARLKDEVCAAVLRLRDEGTYPSVRALRTAGVRGYEQLLLILRSELAAEGRISLGRSPRLDPIRRDPEARDRTKARIFGAVVALQAEGVYPSIAAIEERMPGVRNLLIYELRLELLEDGEIAIGRNYAAAARGLDGSTDESRAEIEARRLRVLAEKVGRGEEPYRHEGARR